MKKFLKDKILHGRFDKKWRGAESFITTGGAQMALVWYRLARLTGDKNYLNAAYQMNTTLTAIHQRNVFEPKETKGAIFGSFPFWGRYEPFACPNWASKYLMDTLMNELFPEDHGH